VVDRYGKDSVALYAGTNAILDATGMWAALGFMYRLGSKSIYTVTSIDAINKQILIEQITSFSTSGLIPQVDFNNTDLLLIIGSNLVVSHGHLAGIPYPGKRLRDIKNRGGQVIVADPHKTQTSKFASCHIQPKPGSDYAWLGFVIRELLLGDQSENLIDWEYIQQHSNGVEQIKEIVDYFDEKTVVRITGVDIKTLHNLVEIIKKSKKISGISGTGLSFCNSGIVSEWFLWVLLAIKGSLDKPGGIWFNPGLTTDLSKIEPTIKTQTAWSGRSMARPDLPTRSGEYPVSGLADEIIAKNVRILICVGGNPLSAFPDNSKTLSALNALEALVVLDTHKSDLTDIAEYALPVCGQLERSDSSIYAQNSVSRVSCQYTEKIINPPGEAKPVWWVFSKLGERLGLDVIKLNKKTEEISDYDVLKTIKGGGDELFNDEEFLLSGYVERNNLPFGWVIDSVLPDKKWSLYSDTLATELKRVLDEERISNNFLLISVREKDHLNSQFILNNDECKIPKVIINSFDAKKYEINNDELVELHSDVNFMQACVFISQDALVGTISVSHGFKKLGNVSRLTSSEYVNPLSGMVTQSAIHVQIKKIRKQF
jgi:anaerobic selenocysteine-containing dehydrogenase